MCGTSWYDLRNSARKMTTFAVSKDQIKSEKALIMGAIKVGHYLPLMVPNTRYSNHF